MKPIIGITVNYESSDRIGLYTQHGTKDQDWHFIAGDYGYSIEKAGGVPLLIPCLKDSESAKEIIRKLDGLLISGGVDVNPAVYGQKPTYTQYFSDMRDQTEKKLIEYAIKDSDIPVLGICRGIQMLNASLGGTLYQDLIKEGNYPNHSIVEGCKRDAVHLVMLKEGSRLHQIFESQEIDVNSFHHQGVKDVAEGFEATAFSSGSIVEGIELKSDRFVVGVQWHPEMMDDSDIQAKLFSAFVKACSKE